MSAGSAGLKEPDRSASVAGSGKRDTVGVGVSVGGARAIFDRAGVGGQKLESALDSSLVFADLGEVFESFAVATVCRVGEI